MTINPFWKRNKMYNRWDSGRNLNIIISCISNCSSNFEYIEPSQPSSSSFQNSGVSAKSAKLGTKIKFWITTLTTDKVSAYDLLASIMCSLIFVHYLLHCIFYKLRNQWFINQRLFIRVIIHNGLYHFFFSFCFMILCLYSWLLYLLCVYINKTYKN